MVGLVKSVLEFLFDEREQIPANLDEALIALDKLLVEEDKEALRTGKVTPISLHHSFGRWLRNRWELWSHSTLKEWFLNEGVEHPDDMSAIVLESYMRKLRGHEIDLRGQIAECQSYYKRDSKGKAWRVSRK